MSPSDPAFPPEIEYIIFTNTLALKVVRVEHSICFWLIPTIMQTVAICAIQHGQALSYPPSRGISTLHRYGNHTHNLFIWLSKYHLSEFTVDQYFSLCPNVTDLLLWTGCDIDRAQLDLMSRLPLTRLSMDLDRIPETTPELIRLFSKITHLEHITPITPSSYPALLKSFTNLTHLALPDGSSQSVVTLLFNDHPRLQVLILLESNTEEILRLTGGFDSNLDDLRVVFMMYKVGSEVEEWRLDVQEGRGMWGLADEAIAERRKLKAAMGGEGKSL
ncbi:hypothetical protein BDN72DRAFT_840185 [Pluteus cervinus]|uniref:Uncharacterized protein n=1 Tax=Pluteus cervinus TaxID=181527 RepID=A0ACD3AVK7_9AGAR|nr:hypothetical protein BDN72DRAFT_840185 [Pluteus cervinus]